MDINNGIDSKPRTRRGRHFSDRLVTSGGDNNGDITDSRDSSITLNVRVKERENSGNTQGPVGSVFKETPPAAIRSFFFKESNQNLKDTIKRPLTGLFQRANSRASSKVESKNESRTETDISIAETLIFRNGEAITSSLLAPSCEKVLHDVDAPSVNVNHASTVCQFDFMNAKNSSLAKLDDIDLSPLSRFLCLEEEVGDEKVSWTWDYLFASVSTEMRDEWAQDEERDGADYDGGNLIK